MRKYKIWMIAIAVLFVCTACSVKQEQNFVQVGDMVFYYTGEPAISSEDDGSAEAMLKETVLDYRGYDGEEKDIYFAMGQAHGEFKTLEEFDAMMLEFQNNQGLAEMTFRDMNVDGTKAHRASVGYNEEIIVFVGFIYKDTSYLIYCSTPIDSAVLVDGFIKKIELQ